ncbi:MAG: RNA-guided pseudouridylation complex pseudouridine synthase subunit Cbf5 [DPANN group archaeon]|nr:RNA-guided pseudouridylation complex pseudouridine synthase subunit Cbf5 [DPANN group archaeon]
MAAHPSPTVSPVEPPVDTRLPFEKIKREILVRRQADTSPRYGCSPDDRPTESLLTYGIINLNKPSGPSSHQVSAYVQQILGIDKSGHSGTLDPKVTGVLPVALGRGTRIVQTLLPAGKEYVCLMHLHKPVERDVLRTVLSEFVGKIKQLPPVKSAVKRQYRFRRVYYIELLDVLEQDVLFKTGTQAGTYIRKLVHDMGVRFGFGAHMTELRRTKAGPFHEDDGHTLQDLADAFHYYKEENNDSYLRHVIRPIEEAVAHLPKCWVLDSTVETLCHGADLKVPGIVKVESEIQIDELVAVMTLKGELIAVGPLKMLPKDILKADKGVAIRIHKVFMQPGSYPKIEKAD